MTAVFLAALAFTLPWEGGFVHHENDPGGATMRGITQRTYDSWQDRNGLPRGSVEYISADTASRIYYEMYWVGPGIDSVDDPALAVALFDYGVNSGVGRIRKWVENPVHWTEVVDERMQFLTQLTNFNSFGRGWVRRVEALRQYITSTYPEQVALVQFFDGTDLVAAFHPVKTTPGVTASGRRKLMFGLTKEVTNV